MVDERTENSLRVVYTHATREFWESVDVGANLGSYEYDLDEGIVDEYRRVVGDEAAQYPTVAARHGQRLYEAHFDRSPGLTNAGIEARYLRPPRQGTIRVDGRMADKYERRGKLYVVIEARAFDELSAVEPFEVTRLIGLLQGMSEVSRND